MTISVTCTPVSGLEQNTVFYWAPESGTRRIRSQLCMTHVPETGAGKSGVDLWRRFLERVSWVLRLWTGSYFLIYCFKLKSAFDPFQLLFQCLTSARASSEVENIKLETLGIGSSEL